MDLSKLTLGSTPINLKAPLPLRATLADKPFSLNASGRLNPLPSQTQSTAVAPTSPSPKITKFAKMIKEKYPQYADVDDEELAKMVLEKYPVYADKLDKLDLGTTAQAEPKKSLGEQLRTMTPGNIIKGQLKGLGSTILSMGEIGSSVLEKGYNATIGKLTGKEALKGAETAKQAKESALLTPQNMGQKTGFLTEQVAEFFLPIPGGAKAKAAQFGGELISGIAKNTPKAGKVLEFAGKVGADVADATARTYLQTAKTDSATDAAIWTGLLGAPLRGAEMLAQAAGPALSSRIVNSLIKPSKRDFAYGKNPGKAIADEGIVAKNFDELQQKVSETKSKIGEQIEAVLTSERYANKTLSVDDALATIDEAIAAAKKSPRTNSAKIKRLEDIKADLLGETVDEAGNVVLTRNTKDLTIEEINNLKKEVGEMTAFTGNPSDDALVNSVLQNTYRRLADKVEQIAPEIKALNQKYGDFLAAEKAIKNRAEIVQRHNLVSLPQIEYGSGAAIVTAIMSGGAAVPTLLAGAGVAGMQKLLSTPKAKTAIAAWLATAKPSQLLEIYRTAPRVFEILMEEMAKDENEKTPESVDPNVLRPMNEVILK